jgi:HK97 family phage prohead protease
MGAAQLDHARCETKRLSADLAAIGETGLFEGYASLFHIVDLGRDMVMPGAFRSSLTRKGATGIKMLWQHDATQPIGSWHSISEDTRGLKVRGQLNLAVSRAREVSALLRAGVVDGLSIGFRTTKAHADKATGVRLLQEIDLWEISIVTFPMLPQARVSAVKQADLQTRWHAAARDVQRCLEAGRG